MTKSEFETIKPGDIVYVLPGFNKIAASNPPHIVTNMFQLAEDPQREYTVVEICSGVNDSGRYDRLRLTPGGWVWAIEWLSLPQQAPDLEGLF